MTPAESEPGDFGPRMARRVAARTGVRRHTGGARSIGIVSRSAVGFGQAIGRSRQTRPDVTADSLTSLHLRPPDGWWHTLGGAADLAEPIGAARTWTDDLVPPTRHTRRPGAAPATARQSTAPAAPAPVPAAPTTTTAATNQPPATGLGRLDALRNMLAAGVAPDGSAISPDVLQQQRPDDDVPAERLAPQRPVPRNPVFVDVAGADAPATAPGSRHSLTEAGPATGPGALARRSQPEPVAPGTTAHRSPDPAAPAGRAEPDAPASPRASRFGRAHAGSEPGGGPRGRLGQAAPAARPAAPGDAPATPGLAVSPGRMPAAPSSPATSSPLRPDPGRPDPTRPGRSGDAVGRPVAERTSAASTPTASLDPAGRPIAPTRAGVGAAAAPARVSARPDEGEPATPAMALAGAITAADSTTPRTAAPAGADDLRLQRLIATDPTRQRAAVAQSRRPAIEPVAVPEAAAVRPATNARRRAEHHPRPVPALPGSGTDQPVRRVTLPRAMSHAHRPVAQLPHARDAAAPGRPALPPTAGASRAETSPLLGSPDVSGVVPTDPTRSAPRTGPDVARRALDDRPASGPAVSGDEPATGRQDVGSPLRSSVDGASPRPPVAGRPHTALPGIPGGALTPDIAVRDRSRTDHPPVPGDHPSAPGDRRPAASAAASDVARRVAALDAAGVHPAAARSDLRAAPAVEGSEWGRHETSPEPTVPADARPVQPPAGARPATAAVGAPARSTPVQPTGPAGADDVAPARVVPARPTAPVAPADTWGPARLTAEADAPERARRAQPPRSGTPALPASAGDVSVPERTSPVQPLAPDTSPPRARAVAAAAALDRVLEPRPPVSGLPGTIRRAIADPVTPERDWHTRPAVSGARSEARRALADAEASARIAATPRPVAAPAPAADPERVSVRPPAAVSAEPSRVAGASVLRRALAAADDDVTARAAGRPRSDAGAALAERFMTELSQAVRARPAPLPTPFQPMAEQIAGRRNVLLSTDTASRRALRSVGKRAATVGDTIHVDATARQLVAPTARLTEVVAHELTHVAHHSPAPRFFDDIDESPEERRAESVARMIARAPLAPAASTLAAPHAAASRDVIRRSPASPAAAAASGSTPGTIRADELAARITAPDVVHRQHTVAAPPRPAAPPPPAPPAPAAPVSTAPVAPVAAPPPAPEPSDTDSGQIRDRDEEFRDLLERHLDVILRRVEDHILIDIERRGGRAWRGF